MSFFLRATPLKHGLKKKGSKNSPTIRPFLFPEYDIMNNFLKRNPSYLRLRNIDTHFNIRENDSSLTISSSLPKNIGKDNIKVEVNKERDGSHWLDIQIAKKDEVKNEEGNFYKKFSTRIQKSYHLDPSVYNLEKTNAHVDGDNLFVSIPKMIESHANKINVAINESKKKEEIDSNTEEVESK